MANKRKSFFSFFLIVFFSLCFFSCSDVSGKILYTTATVIFDYETEKSMPKTWFSVFVQTESEAQRGEQLEISTVKSDLTWKINELQFIKNGNKNWVGYSSLLPYENEKIKSGIYKVKYTDSAGNQGESSFLISYNEKLLESNSGDIKKYVTNNLTENIALYDKNDNLLYYGKRKSTWKLDSSIKRDYNSAVYMRKTLSTVSGSLLFLLPKEDFNNKEEKR